MFKNIIKFFLPSLRAILFFPFHILNKLSSIYSKLLNFIDPNGSECYWEELSQKQIDSRINSTLRYKNLDQHKSNIFDYKKGLNFYTPTKVASYRAHTLFSKEKETVEWIDDAVSAISDLKLKDYDNKTLMEILIESSQNPVSTGDLEDEN